MDLLDDFKMDIGSRKKKPGIDYRPLCCRYADSIDGAAVSGLLEGWTRLISLDTKEREMSITPECSPAKTEKHSSSCS